MISELRIDGIRMFRSSRLTLKPFNLLVGPNGSGKSTVLEVLGSLDDSREAYGPSKIAQCFPSPRTPGAQATVSVTSSMEASAAFLEWSFSAPHSLGQRRFTPQGPSGSSLLESLVAFCRSILIYQFNLREMRQPVAVQTTERLASDGSNLSGFLDYIRDNSDERFAAVETDLARATGLFDKIGFDRPQQGQKAFKLRQVGSDTFIPAAVLSEGTVLLLALLALAHQPAPPSMIGIEEPDRGIHPRLYPEVRDALLRLAFPKDFGDSREPVQIVATTHSPYFLDLFSDHPEFITVCERDPETGVRFRNLGDDPEAREILRDTVLGEAWATGALGGVPPGQ